MKFIITVDTEADNQWENYKKGVDNRNIAVSNIKFLPEFQKLCEQCPHLDLWELCRFRYP